jgi:hypothetical protein
MATVVCLIIKCENAPLLIEKRSFATVRHELAFRTFVSAHHQHECDSEQRIELASTKYFHEGATLLDKSSFILFYGHLVFHTFVCESIF